MPQHQNVIGIAFDCDETLTDCSTSASLAALGIDVADFWRRRVGAHRESGWDPILSYLYEMVQISQESPKTRITRDHLVSCGKKLQFYPGVDNLFTHLKKFAASIDHEIELQFFIISSGIGEIIRASSVAEYVSDIWACDFHYNEKNEIAFPKRVVSFTDKTRYLFQITKGMFGPKYRNRSFDVNKRIDDHDLHIPFHQLIFVGDGATDVPCFSLIKKNNGYPFAVFHPHDASRWAQSWGFIEDNRVSNLHRANYLPDSELVWSLERAIRSIADRMSMRSRLFS